jgi:hypothetical protein
MAINWELIKQYGYQLGIDWELMGIDWDLIGNWEFIYKN